MNRKHPMWSTNGHPLTNRVKNFRHELIRGGLTNIAQLGSIVRGDQDAITLESHGLVGHLISFKMYMMRRIPGHHDGYKLGTKTTISA